MKNSTRNKSLLGLVAAMLLTCANSFAQYTDRTAFNLSGAVKEVTSTPSDNYICDGVEIGYTSLKFNRNGKCTTLNEQEFIAKEYMSGSTFERNAKGQISNSASYYTGGFSKTYYTYNAQGRIASCRYVNSDGSKTPTAYCTYDSNGNLTKQGKTVYTILKTDSHGNWLSRRYKNEDGETVNDSRTITYYE